MIVAITGGTGFIGRKLVARHLERGDEVRVLSRRSPGGSGLPNAVRLCHGDLLVHGDLRSFMDKADVLYHCAGEIRDSALMAAVHVEGTRRLIEAASGQIGRWVQLSSVGAYGKRRHGVVTEQTELNPCGIYETTKVEADVLVKTAALAGAFAQVTLRPSNVYGAGMSNRSLYGLINMIRRGWFFFIGNPGAAANYIHVDNVVEALIRCGTIPAACGQVYNLSDHCSMEQFVATIAATLGKKSPRMRLPEWPIHCSAQMLGIIPGFPLTEARVNALTGRAIYITHKIEQELGYRHVVSMETGLLELTESWMREIG